MKPPVKVHFMGVAGSGASAAAAIAKAQGFEVTGCDKEIYNEFTKAFKKKQLFLGHSPDHLFRHSERSSAESKPILNAKTYRYNNERGLYGDQIDVLAISPAITALDPNNVEVTKAKELGISVLTWQEFMGKYLERDKFVIAVCGTHGKSTTTAMVAKLLQDVGSDPTAELGAVVPEWKANYLIGKGKYFVTEADEFNDNFLVTHPDIAVITSLEMDHAEYFKDFRSYKNSFIKFLTQTKQLIVANLKDPNVAEIIKVVMKNLVSHPGGAGSKIATVIDYSKSDFGLALKIPGDYNVMNAQAAFHVGLELGVEPLRIRQSLENFKGIGRRQEVIGQLSGATIISDFGHHPTEIKLTIEALKQKYNDKKLVVVFQPHMFSRTKALFNDFVKVLKELPVQITYILDIYPSREIDTGRVSSKQLVKTINSPKVKYLSSDDLESKLKDLDESDVVVFEGAGSIDKLARDFVNQKRS